MSMRKLLARTGGDRGAGADLHPKAPRQGEQFEGKELDLVSDERHFRRTHPPSLLGA